MSVDEGTSGERKRSEHIFYVDGEKVQVKLDRDKMTFFWKMQGKWTEMEEVRVMPVDFTSVVMRVGFGFS
jgi:hypothetical protein